MANLKRNAETQPQPKNKKSRSSLNKADTSNLADDSLAATPRTAEVALQDDDDETESLTEIAKLAQNLTLPATGRDSWLREFSKKLNDDKTEVLHRLAAARQKIATERAAFEGDFVTLLATALAPLNDEDNTEPQTRPLQITQFAAEDQQLYKQSALLLEESKYLVQEYNRLSQQRSQPSGLSDLKKRFEKGRQSAASAIAAGMKVSQLDIEGLLADKYHEVRGKGEIDGEMMQFGRALLACGVKEEDNQENMVGWSHVASKARKAMARMQDTVEG